jgi:hypothetical protein
VALKVLKQNFPDRPLFRVVEIPSAGSSDGADGARGEVPA